MAKKKNGTICEYLASVYQWLLQITVVKRCTVELRGQQASPLRWPLLFMNIHGVTSLKMKPKGLRMLLNGDMDTV